MERKGRTGWAVRSVRFGWMDGGGEKAPRPAGVWAADKNVCPTKTALPTRAAWPTAGREMPTVEYGAYKSYLLLLKSG